MLIQTLKRDFAVLRVLETTRDLDISVCRDLLEQGEDRHYLVITVKNPDLIYRTLPFFTALQQNPAFQDFRECFAQEGQFYMVFAYYDSPLLAEKLAAGDYLLTERLEIGKSLLSRVVLQDMPPGLQYEALQEHNLLLDDTLTVRFNYRLREIPSYPSLTAARVQAELARVFRTLLAREIAAQAAEELPVFLEELERGAFTAYLDIYQAYDRVYMLLKTRQEAGEMEPKSRLFRFWDRVKGLARYVKPVLAGLVLATALGYLAYTFMCPADTAGEGNAPFIEKIGAVDIK